MSPDGSDVFDAVVVGAGIVGLATAWRVLGRNPGWGVAVLDKEDRIAAHQTGHNSGVLHSGIYYKPGSLKAENCRRGLSMMLEFAAEHGIAHEVCGKVIVATCASEMPTLEKVYEKGVANGVGCRMIGADELREHEPCSAGIAAIHVEDAGIIDYGAVCGKLAELIGAAGGEIRTGTRLHGVRREGGVVRLCTSGGDVLTRRVVNCGGLHSDRVTKMTGATPEVRIVPFRGEYFVLHDGAKDLVRNLIYPVPDPRFPFLGVHFTRMVTGQIECGPNAVLALAREGYTWGAISPVDFAGTLTTPGFWRFAGKHWRMGFGEMWRSLSKRAFLKSLQELVPEVRGEDIMRAEAGVRAQAMRATGDLLDDFSFTTLDGVVNVCNAPSPAATSSLSIGDTIADQVEGIKT